jgi:hypothetical protein
LTIDISDLPQTAQFRIRKAENEAAAHLAASRGAYEQDAAEAYNLGVDFSRIGWSPGNEPLEVANREFSDGRDEAAKYLIAATANEYSDTITDIDTFESKLNAIEAWASKKFRASTYALDSAKYQARAIAFGKWEARLAAAVPAKTSNRVAVDAYIEEVFRVTGKELKRVDLWRSVGYRSRSDFECWERGDPRATKAASERFTAILREKPHLK